MPTCIKQFTDNSILEFDKGNFDSYCVYLTQPNIPRYAPLDHQYFTRFKQLGQIHGDNTIYQDFVQIYNLTNKAIDPKVLALISNLAQKYGKDELEIDKLFTTIYAGMIAEENKTFTKLGKRVKRLGMHQVLIENMPPNDAANYSKGRSWGYLDSVMKQKGF